MAFWAFLFIYLFILAVSYNSLLCFCYLMKISQ